MVINSSFKTSHVLLLLALLLSTETSLRAQKSTTWWSKGIEINLPENWETRLRYRHFISAPIQRLSSVKTHQYRQREDSRRVAFQVRKRGDAVFLLFVGENELGEFPLLQRGNVSIKRNRDTGDFLYMTVLIRDHPECFLRVYPGEGRSYLDVILYGVEIHHRLILPKKFSSLLVSPISQIIQLTQDRVPWHLFLNRAVADPKIMEMIKVIRSQIPRLKDCENGAYSSSGEPVYISTETPSGGGMNCSGFAKWIVDGFYFPLKGRYMDIGKLKEKPLDCRGNRWSQRYEQERDPYFGLDWSRNLALELHEARGGPAGVSPEEFDVRDVEYMIYREDIGYPVSNLELLLFILASRNPQRFYLGSLNREFGDDPTMRQHVHLVVLMPYFSEDGAFDIAVFERNKETDLTSLLQRFPNDYIHLVGIEVEGVFQPKVF
jgi:hypothetical protein